MLLLQRVPHPTKGIPATTCRHLQCPYQNAIFKGGDFLLSLEKPESCDPLRNPLSYKAIAPISRVLASGWNHVSGKRGLGADGEERWHLTCLESLLREVRKRQLLASPENDIPTWAPSMEFGQHIVADERQLAAHPGKFNVDSPYQFGLELWKATQLFDSRLEHGASFKPTVPPHIHVPEVLLVGRDGLSLYLTNEARDFRGKMPWGEIAEISAADGRGVTLYEMTQRVSAILTPRYEAKRALQKQNNEARKAQNGAEVAATSPRNEGTHAANDRDDDTPKASE